MTETPKPMQGIWTLIAPDGTKLHGDSPLQVCAAEQRLRVPASVGVARIFAAIDSEVLVPVEPTIVALPTPCTRFGAA